jgi:hypothetical protein
MREFLEPQVLNELLVQQLQVQHEVLSIYAHSLERQAELLRGSFRS